MNIHDIIRSVWRNHPRCVSTMSMCDCGREARRGGEPCLQCLADKLVATGKVSREIVLAWFATIDKTRRIELELATIIDEDVEL